MNKKPIVDSLKSVTEGQAFITCVQLTKALGCKDQRKVKDKFLRGLEAIDGKYYLIVDVAEVLQKRMV
jgi:hypothetical protein